MWNGIVRHKIRIRILVKSAMNICIFHEMRRISLVERTNITLSRRLLLPWKQLVILLTVAGIAGGNRRWVVWRRPYRAAESKGCKRSNLNLKKNLRRTTLNDWVTWSVCQSATVDGRYDSSPRATRNLATPLLTLARNLWSAEQLHSQRHCAHRVSS
jgi:hypothetical protein